MMFLPFTWVVVEVWAEYQQTLPTGIDTYEDTWRIRKQLTRMGRDYVTQRKHEQASKSSLPGALEQKNGQGRNHALPIPDSPRKWQGRQSFSHRRNRNSFPFLIRVFRLHLSVYSDRQKFFPPGPSFPRSC